MEWEASKQFMANRGMSMDMPTNVILSLRPEDCHHRIGLVNLAIVVAAHATEGEAVPLVYEVVHGRAGD